MTSRSSLLVSGVSLGIRSIHINRHRLDGANIIAFQLFGRNRNLDWDVGALCVFVSGFTVSETAAYHRFSEPYIHLLSTAIREWIVVILCLWLIVPNRYRVFLRSKYVVQVLIE